MGVFTNPSLALDFSKLDSISAAEQQYEPDAAPPNSPELAKLQREADKETERRLEAREIYARYQNNIMRCGSLRNDLLKKSAAKSATVEELLLIAAEIIDRMTGDNSTTTLKVLRRNLYEQYGIGEKLC